MAAGGPVYTKRLFEGVVSGPGVTAQVPANATWIVTDADFVHTSTEEGSAGLMTGLGHLWFFVDSESATLKSQWFPWRGRQALSPGETFTIYWGAGTWHVVITGYQFSASA